MDRYLVCLVIINKQSCLPRYHGQTGKSVLRDRRAALFGQQLYAIAAGADVKSQSSYVKFCKDANSAMPYALQSPPVGQTFQSVPED
jgi:hypothetical protein